MTTAALEPATRISPTLRAAECIRETALMASSISDQRRQQAERQHQRPGWHSRCRRCSRRRRCAGRLTSRSARRSPRSRAAARSAVAVAASVTVVSACRDAGCGRNSTSSPRLRPRCARYASGKNKAEHHRQRGRRRAASHRDAPVSGDARRQARGLRRTIAKRGACGGRNARARSAPATITSMKQAICAAPAGCRD